MAYARPRRNQHARSDAEVDGDYEPQLILYESTDTDNGHKFSFNTDDGQARDEELTILNPDTDEEEIVIKGSYSYVMEGLLYKVDYTADRNGYHANVHKPVPTEDAPNEPAVAALRSHLPPADAST